MNEFVPAAETESDVISLNQLTGMVVRGWRLIAWCMAGMILLAIVYLHFAKVIYTAELDISPAQSSTGLSNKLGSGLGDLAAITGVSLGGDDNGSQFELYVEGLQSYAVADALSKRTDLMKVLFKQEWDEKTHSWVNRAGLGQAIKDGIKYVLGIPVTPWQPPNGARVQQFLKQQIKIDQSTKKLLVEISFSSQDPVFAANFLRVLHETTDNLLRQHALVRATQYTAYLASKLGTVTIGDYRAALTQTMIEQEKQKMAASSNVPFAAEPFGVPGVPVIPSSPHSLLILIGSVVIGLFIGTGLCFAVASGYIRNPWLRNLAG